MAVQPLGRGEHEIRRLGHGQRAGDLFIRGAGLAPLQVFPNGAAEQRRALGRHADAAAQLAQAVLLYVRAKDLHRSLRSVIHAGNQVHQRGFAAARAADHADGAAPRRGKGNIRQRRRARARIAEAYALEFDGVRAFLRLRARAVHDGGPQREQFVQPRGGSAAARHLHDQVGKREQRHEDLRHIVHQRHDLALRDAARKHAIAALPHEQGNGRVHNRAGGRVEQRGQAARAHLRAQQFAGFRLIIRLFARLARKRADHARAG